MTDGRMSSSRYPDLDRGKENWLRKTCREGNNVSGGVTENIRRLRWDRGTVVR